ncbi:hypothetical protein AeNC1_001912 [Aphanomyces euteiches]|nr:hypothetical protein AeNC1_001912 [Aphanomyces euteiches]
MEKDYTPLAPESGTTVRTTVEDMTLNHCDLGHLPRLGKEIVKLPEMSFKAFNDTVRSGEIVSIALIQGVDEMELNTSSTVETDVVRRQGRISLIEDLGEFEDVFPEEVPETLPKDLVPGTKWWVTRQWPLPKEQVDHIDAFFEKRRKAGHVRPNTSPHSSPTFSVKEDTGGWRIVHAFNKLNATTVLAQTPIPREDVIIDGMAGSTIFLTIDLRDGFYQTLTSVCDVPNTAVSTPSGMQLEWLVMSQGLSNALAAFNRLVTGKLRPLRDFAPSYFDDIYVHSKGSETQNDVEVHRGHLRAVLEVFTQICRNACSGFPRSPYRGFCRHQWMSSGPFESQGHQHLDYARQRARATQFAWACNVFAQVLKELCVDSTTAITAVIQGRTLEDAFDGKNKEPRDGSHSSVTTHQLPVFGGLRRFRLQYRLLLNEVNDCGVNRLVSFQSRQLRKAERNYLVHDLEPLTIKYALVKFRIYLLDSKPFLVYTDHASLRYAVKTSHLSERMARWLAYFAENSMTVEYKPGRENILADALSRRPSTEIETDIALSVITQVHSDLYDRI